MNQDNKNTNIAHDDGFVELASNGTVVDSPETASADRGVQALAAAPPPRQVGNMEKWSYIVGMGFLGMFFGMVRQYRNFFVVSIAGVSMVGQQIINVSFEVINWLLMFLMVYIVDNSRRRKSGKFKPFATATFIPYALLGILVFYFPPALSQPGNSILSQVATGVLGVNPWGLVYLLAVWLLFHIAMHFANTFRSINIVITPNEKERNEIFSWNAIFESVMNSAPLIVLPILGVFPGLNNREMPIYIVAMAICGTLYAVSNFISLKNAKERIPYLETPKIPFVKTLKNMVHGVGFVVKNKNWRWFILTTFVRNFYQIGTGFGIFVALVVLGDVDMFVIFALPTGIGALVGLLGVKAMMKKGIDNIANFKIWGIASLAFNIIAFAIGFFYIQSILGANLPDDTAVFARMFVSPGLAIPFFLFMFLAGTQSGASSMLPRIIDADILNEIELQSGGKRLEVTYGFTNSIVLLFRNLFAAFLFPLFLHQIGGFPEGAISRILEWRTISHLATNTDTLFGWNTAVWMLFFFTLWVGIFYAVSLLPFMGYKLNAKRRTEILAKLEVMRAERK